MWYDFFKANKLNCHKKKLFDLNAPFQKVGKHLQSPVLLVFTLGKIYRLNYFSQKYYFSKNTNNIFQNSENTSLKDCQTPQGVLYSI